MIIATTAGLVEVWADTNTSLDNVVVSSKDDTVLFSVLDSIELAGASEDDTGANKVGSVVFVPTQGCYALHMDRTTFKLWHNFEVDNYLKYGRDEFEIAIPDETYRHTISEIRKFV